MHFILVFLLGTKRGVLQWYFLFEDKFLLVSGLVRKSLVDEFVENNADGPNVAFVIIILLKQNLRGHIKRSAHFALILAHILLHSFRESEVSYLHLSQIK